MSSSLKLDSEKEIEWNVNAIYYDLKKKIMKHFYEFDNLYVYSVQKIKLYLKTAMLK